MASLTLIGYASVAVLATGLLLRSPERGSEGLRWAVEAFFKLVPRMTCALVTVSFAVRLIPPEIIGSFLGVGSGFRGILIGAAAGVLVPAGPVICFAMAAAFAEQGASLPALVSFVTAWSVFAAHRILIFESPLLGVSFVRLRLASVAILPIVAGALTMVVALLLQKSGP